MEPVTKNIDISHTVLHDYNPKWAEVYRSEAQKIKDLLGDKITSIEHIGSTSIPGLVSKPIIDIAITVESWKNAQDLLGLLSTLEYRSESNQINESNAGERWLLRKGNPTQFHLSMAYADRGSFLERQILFRDYLREHDGDRDDYGQLKKEKIHMLETRQIL
jgi:GrpB-like predicted nucleotidyltransferase (UPF0157 family)